MPMWRMLSTALRAVPLILVITQVSSVLTSSEPSFSVSPTQGYSPLRVEVRVNQTALLDPPQLSSQLCVRGSSDEGAEVGSCWVVDPRYAWPIEYRKYDLSHGKWKFVLYKNNISVGDPVFVTSLISGEDECREAGKCR